MNPDALDGVMAFLRSAERLKGTYRSAWTSNGGPESVAAHTWRLCLMALLLAEHFPEVDPDRLIRMLLVHDLGEALHGDIPAPQQDSAPGNRSRSAADLQAIPRQMAGCRDLPMGRHDREAMASPEAAGACTTLMRVEQELLALLEMRTARDQKLLRSMRAGAD